MTDGHAVLEADDNCVRDIVRNHFQTLTTAFRVFDSDGDGLVSFAEFKHGLGLAGLSGLPDERVEQLWRIADEGDLGFLSMAQLASFLKV
jgi:Ca2+-binding EF-hand superfamily protein